MKVVLVSEFFPISIDGTISGGVEARNFYLAKELGSLGHNVTVITSRLPKTPNSEVWWGNVRVLRVGLARDYTQSGQLLKRGIFFLSSIIASLRVSFDIIDGSNGVVFLGVVIAGKLAGKKSIHWVPDVVGLKDWSVTQGFIGAHLADLLEKSIGLFPADHVIALSQSTKRKLLKIGVKPGNLSVVYPGIAQEFLNESRLDQKIPHRILSVQRLALQKRTDLVIKAVALLDKDFPGLSYQVIGTGDQMASLKKLAKELRVEKKVFFHGNLPHQQVLKFFQQADIFSLPSEVEGFGIVTLEAMGAEVPFVNSDIAPHREILAKSSAGLLFENGNSSDLALKIKTLLTDKKLYQKCHLNALVFAKKHTWKNSARETEKVYQNIL